MIKFLFLIMASSSLYAAISYQCIGRVTDRMHHVIAEKKKNVTVEGNVCTILFDIDSKAFSICTQEVVGKMGITIEDQNSPQASKAMSSYGTGYLEVYMQSAMNADFHAILFCNKTRSY